MKKKSTKNKKLREDDMLPEYDSSAVRGKYDKDASLRNSVVIHYDDGTTILQQFDEKSKYEIIIYWSNKDNAFIAEVPQLRGCMADGKTLQETLANAKVVIKEWIQTAKKLGRSIPKPKSGASFA